MVRRRLARLHDTNDFVDTMQTGMGAREQPLMLIITTAGFNISGPCFDQETDAKKMLEGVLPDEELFSLIYTIDEDDKWDDPKSLYKANPNLGVSVDEDFLLASQKKAVNSAAHQTKFKTKHLNVWCSAKSQAINMIEWNKCADYTLRREQFIGVDNWASIDLASTSDIAVDMQVFCKKIEGKNHYYLFGDYHLPENAIENDSKNRDAYRKWVIEGFLIQHDGAEIDYDIIGDYVTGTIKTYNPNEIAFDPWKAAHLAQRLMKDGAVCVEFRQTVQNLSGPMKEFISAISSGRLHHDGNPVLTWMASNLVAKLDAKDNIYPRKDKPEQKIDGMVAAIMGIARAMANTQQENIDDFINNPIIG
jgi:phage terminase large subunit-like protein